MCDRAALQRKRSPCIAPSTSTISDGEAPGKREAAAVSILLAQWEPQYLLGSAAMPRAACKSVTGDRRMQVVVALFRVRELATAYPGTKVVATTSS